MHVYKNFQRIFTRSNHSAEIKQANSTKEEKRRRFATPKQKPIEPKAVFGQTKANKQC
jgi:hypothetical protein